MEIKQVRELMLKAFKKGQDKYEAEDYPIRLWISGELDELNKDLKDNRDTI